LTIEDTQTLAVSVAEAAKIVGLGRTKVYAAIADGTLPTVKIGRRRLVRIEALNQWLKDLER